MGWIQPKTDWDNTSRLNAEDYNRIKNNLSFLKDLGTELYPSFTIADLGEDKAVDGNYWAREFNALEDCLETINSKTYPQNYGTKPVFVDNGPFINAMELNRLESAILNIYNMLLAQKTELPRLAFMLGGQKGIKV